MIIKIVGFIFAIVGGALLGIALMSDLDLPMWWWMMALLFLCVGIIGVFLVEDD
jgi:CDP-diglyceride synthetase